MIKILDDNNIKYIIKKGRYKRLTIHFDKNNILIINKPNFIPESYVINFVETKIDWIINHKNNYIGGTSSLHTNNSNYLLFGEEYLLNVHYDNKEYYERDIANKIIHLYVKKDEHILKLLEKMRYELAGKIFNDLLFEASQVMQDIVPNKINLIIKASKRNWGYNKKSEQLVMLNISLIHTPLICINYVVYHELCHFKYSNHSKEFHALLQHFIPDERKIRKLLQNYSITYN